MISFRGGIWRWARHTASSLVSRRQGGDILIMTLVMVIMFVTIFAALVGLVGRQFHQTVLQAHDESAFQVAEAGLNYARWRLAHDPQNFEGESRDVSDQFSGTAGSFTVTFEAPQAGSSIVDITSVGTSVTQPTREVTLRARYGLPSLAQYAVITNDDVWYGGQISGYVHSNGGIRMDGQSSSLMTSAQETYICKPYHGCDNEEKPGIWGSGGNQDLWDFPVSLVDYASLTNDLLDMQAAADANGTAWGPSNFFGYHVKFLSNNTVSIYRVKKLTSNIWSWASDTGWQYTSHDIQTEQLLETRAVPSNGVMYFEDTVWVDGDIRDRVTVAAGDFSEDSPGPRDIIINGSISYGGVTDGSRAFGAIAQGNMLIPYSGAPDNLTLDGAYIAQLGRFGRRYYYYGPHRLKTSMTRYGMIASNLVPVTAWVDDAGQVVSGYQTGQTSYDPNLLYAPPPYFPTTGQYEFISWEQVE